MLDRLYRALVGALPAEYGEGDREEILETYHHRVAAAAARGAGAALRERLREVADLLGILLVAWSPLPSPASLLQDVRIGLRGMRRAPLASGLAVVSLALGIGATSSLFSALDVWLVRPLPLPNAPRLVSVGMANMERGWERNPFSRRDYLDWAAAAETVELGVYAQASYNVAGSDGAERVSALTVSANLPDILGVQPVLGRSFMPEEGRDEGPRVALATHAYWQTHLAGDPGVVGRVVALDGVPHTLVGVLPADQEIPGAPADLWTPLRFGADEPRTGHYLWGVGLLDGDVALAAVRQELASVAARVVEADPERTFPAAAVRPLRDAIYGRQFFQGGAVLGGAALFVLLIACANIANILLAQGLARSQEMAVRLSLGAGRRRVVQQVLVESLVVAVLGGVLGVALGHVGVDLLLAYALPEGEVPGWGQIALNGRIVALSAFLTILCTLVFGMVPALRAARVNPGTRLRDDGRAGVGARRGRLGRALVAGEIAASLALVSLTGLMIRALSELQTTDMGMRTDDALVFRLDVPSTSHPTPEAVATFYGTLQQRLEALPGVTGVAAMSGHPLQQWSTTAYGVSGLESHDERWRSSAEYRRVSPSYLDLMGLTLLAGRWLDPATDVADGPRVAVVSRTLAERWWTNPSDAVGQTLEIAGTQRLIVGVVESGRLRGPTQAPPPVIFESLGQRASRYTFILLGLSADPQGVATAAREVVRSLDPNLAVFGIQTLEQMLDQSVGPQRAVARILGTLGGMALLLTLVGVYGVVAHSVGRRRREMGLRLALGADAAGVVAMILAANVRTALLGLGIGLVVSLVAGQGMTFLLVGVQPWDPTVLVPASVAMLLAVVAASWVPARRAGRVDPVQSLREE